jgi:hypothetical protein
MALRAAGRAGVIEGQIIWPNMAATQTQHKPKRGRNGDHKLERPDESGIAEGLRQPDARPHIVA